MDTTPIDYAGPTTPRPARDRRSSLIVHDADGVQITHGPVGWPLQQALAAGALILFTAALLITGLSLLVISPSPAGTWIQTPHSATRPSMFGPGFPQEMYTDYTFDWQENPAATARKASRQRRLGIVLALIGLATGGLIWAIVHTGFARSRRVVILSLDRHGLRLQQRTPTPHPERSWPRAAIAGVFVDVIQGKTVWHNLALATRDGGHHPLIVNLPPADAHAISAALNAGLENVPLAPVPAE